MALCRAACGGGQAGGGRVRAYCAGGCGGLGDLQQRPWQDAVGGTQQCEVYGVSLLTAYCTMPFMRESAR